MPYTPDIAEHIALWATKPSNAEYFRRSPPVQDWLRKDFIDQLFAGSWIIYEDDAPVGLLSMHSLDPYARSCEWAILIDKDSSAHSHNTAMEMIHQACEYSFNYKNLHKIYVKLLDHRDNLKLALESVGATLEVTLRDSVYFNGEYRNEYLLSMLKLEYKGRK